MGKLTGKGKHTVKVGNHPHTNMKSNPVIMKGGKYKCRILEMHSKLRDQQLKTILYSTSPIYEPSSCKLSKMQMCVHMSNHVRRE